MEAKHTSGEWRLSKHSPDTVCDQKGHVIAEFCGYSVKVKDPIRKAQGGREANAERVIACVNPLQVVSDPAAFVEKAIQLCEEYEAGYSDVSLADTISELSAILNK